MHPSNPSGEADLQGRLVYTADYDIEAPPVLERLHPFDGRKFSRAYATICALRPRADSLTVRPPAPATDAQLASVHTHEYLASLDDPVRVARVLELPAALAVPIRWMNVCLPWWRPHDRMLVPMRWGGAGTVVAAGLALDLGAAVNLSGGYHHAGPDRGEGFCVFADVAIAVHHLRQTGRLDPGERVVHVDLDAHQGNGVARCFLNDRSVSLFDMFNGDIYPSDARACLRVDRALPLRTGTGTVDYLSRLRDELPAFLDGLTSRDGRPPRLAFYNAGTDIYRGDALGGLDVSDQGVLERDLFVTRTLTAAGIPWVMVLSGGYSAESYRLVADSVAELIGSW